MGKRKFLINNQTYIIHTRPHTMQPQPCRPMQTTHVGEILTAL